MESISVEQRTELINSSRSVLKLELRDHYRIDAEDLEAWRRGDHDALTASYQLWADEMAEWSAVGRSLRRVRLISEPLSDYQRMSVEYSGSAVDVGEELRWLPRAQASRLLLPANDCFILDGRLVIFNVLDGNDLPAARQLWTESAVVAACLSAFESAWSVAIPHHAFRVT